MSTPLYQPFSTFNLGNKHCFLSGQPLSHADEQVSVFPTWLMQRFSLQEQPFKMLDDSMLTYADLKLPCSAMVYQQYLQPLEAELEQAINLGYAGLSQLNPLSLFKWAGKILYGIIFNEMQTALRQAYAQGMEFNPAQGMLHKFGNLHLMLQSINGLVEFEEFTPYSIFLTRVNNDTDTFSYRDEINTLTFSLRMNDFGLIICLQDNGANKNYHQQVLQKIGAQTLHPIQFEELCGRVFYSAYLFNRLPEYHVMPVDGRIYLEAMPLRGMSSKPLFDEWMPKTYGQVLENFWKKWGFLLFEIIKNPEEPMSFLLDAQGNFIAAESISLPL